jgi:hypothetical protein
MFKPSANLTSGVKAQIVTLTPDGKFAEGEIMNIMIPCVTA